ncbi:MAG TPA: TrkA family potassium uptake protein [Candidatus Faeciplasma gallinarum]|uniref:TrkA family potassium uptake protein n=1 Tax=Candidatus Faeciplasma gallinarum TaxID=2840799 RepID=A0A9D1EN74_9FIRM|nr:TrkA family potassium uptake protein [Candidatus Faeciplasma gallinarum]
MFNKGKSERMSYGIVGLGRFGYALASELAKSGCDLVVLDGDEDKVRSMRDYTDNAYVLTSLEKKALLDTGIQNCDVAVVCIGEHIDTSIMTTLNLVSMNIPKVIAKATSAEHGVILEKLGAEVVYPERDMAIRLANRLEISRMLDVVQLSEQINITKMHVPAQMINKTVVEVNLRSRFNLNIIAIENNGKVIEVVRPDYVFRADDILFLSGSREDIVKLNNWINK